MKMETMPVIRTTNPRMITREMVMKIPGAKILQQGMGRAVMIQRQETATPVLQRGNATKKTMLG